MLLTEKRFFEEVLDLSIPQLCAASEAFAAGNRDEAVKLFANYIRGALDTDNYFKIPYYPRENSWAKGNETDLDVANRLLENKFMACGVMMDFGKDNPIDWFANPCYNKYREWGLQFQRHHEWRCLGRVYRDTGDEKYAECFARIARSWLTTAEECPLQEHPGKTLHWRTIECGIRMNKIWPYAIHSFIKSPSVDDELWLLIFMSLWEHAYRLINNPTTFNWHIMELSGILHLGVFYPCFKERKQWFDHAISELVKEAANQFYPDGLHGELSPSYQYVVIMNYLCCLDTCRCLNVKIPEELVKSIRHMYTMYAKMADPSDQRRTAGVNDSGGASAVKIYEEGLNYFPGDEIMEFFVSDGERGKEPDFKSIVMPYAGMAVMRTGWSHDDIWSFFESAHFGAGHQHEDKLNFLLYAYGTYMLPDSGSFRYDTSEQRKYVLTTRSHNTGMVDGLPQNRRDKYKKIGPGDMLTKSNLEAKLTDDIDVVAGEYNEGYGPEFIPVKHRRKVIFFKKGLGGSRPFFVMLDNFTSCDGKEHFYESSFQLTEAPISVLGNVVTAKYQTGAELTFVSNVFPRITVGQFAPEYMGWRSNHTPEVKVHIPAPILSYSGVGECAEMVTVIYPSPDGDCPITNVSSGDGTFTVTVGGSEFKFNYDDKQLKTELV